MPTYTAGTISHAHMTDIANRPDSRHHLHATEPVQRTYTITTSAITTTTRGGDLQRMFSFSKREDLLGISDRTNPRASKRFLGISWSDDAGIGNWEWELGVLFSSCKRGAPE